MLNKESPGMAELGIDLVLIRIEMMKMPVRIFCTGVFVFIA